jgi:acetolactate synthase-1/2/3 large subunit
VWRERLRAPMPARFPEPRFAEVDGGTAAAFFGALRRALPSHGILVTDSGLHQSLARRYFEVRSPNGHIFPNDFQSMGYGLPAAIGAKIAAPARPVVAVVGDGGFVMSGMELLTAVREQVPLVVVVFHDGRLNQIRLQQLAEFGREHDVALRTPDFASFARAIGMSYMRLAGDATAALRTAIASPEPILVEVLVGDSAAIRALQVRGFARQATRRLLGPRVVAWLKRRLSQIRPR